MPAGVKIFDFKCAIRVNDMPMGVNIFDFKCPVGVNDMPHGGQHI